MTPAPEGPPLATLGDTLRGLRQARGWSLGELSAASGVPTSTISKIENGQMSPSLVHAINLAAALEANLGFLIDRGARPAAFSVMREGARPRLDLPEMGLALQDLHGDFAPGVLEARLGEIAPGGRSGDEPMTHPGEEICHILDGAIRFDIDGEVHDLGPGDTIHFKCSVPHHWENTAPRTTRVVWVFSDGLSF
ncbi:helix-turn-helix domain-containing protein [Ruixingdingia sedimenti]|uniref:XRE family transcriptional regulator n=1 Tax=Ruixingdingia sedimenti TaxID=3073604 RepID=A0ABU1F906_9RHOB|nr:XRE family transcriptional regulator [Xinfangfangia sp. LG-4]MDR5653352.1 XRE family transcriptional regulator [Xinfangfangia sp. LG-4]